MFKFCPDVGLLKLFILIRVDVGAVPATPCIRKLFPRVEWWITTSEMVCSRAVLTQKQCPITTAGGTNFCMFRLDGEISI